MSPRLSVILAALAYILFAHGLRQLTAGETATLTLAEPPTAAFLGAIVLGERPGGVAIGGAALVLVGLLTLAGRPDDDAPATVPLKPVVASLGVTGRGPRR